MQNNLLFEMLPLIAFFAVYYFTKNIFLATGVCIIVSWVYLLLCKIKYKSINKNTWLSTILITVFGGLTILLHNKTFVMLKPSVLYWILAISLLIGQAIGKNGIKIMLQKEVSLPDSVWQRLSLAWSLFFIVMGFLNLYIAFNYSEYIWVKFKVFGGITLSGLWLILSVIYIIICQKKQKPY